MARYLSDDGQAVLALCSALGTEEASESPFTLSEWNELERKIGQSGFRQPSQLFGQPTESIASGLGLIVEEGARIANLLQRADRLGLALEGLADAGIWAVTRVDDLYPARLREALKHHAPSVLFGVGDIRLLQQAGVAVVGSRNIDEAGTRFAREVGKKTAAAGFPVVSGGARGTDRLAMEGALENGGIAIGALADSLEATVRKPDVQEFVFENRLVLITAYAPNAGFSVGAALGRNKMIYGLARFAVVVSSDFKTGGTWSGATEAIKAGWCPVFARDAEDVPTGNRELIKLGAAPLPENELGEITSWPDWLEEHSPRKLKEGDLFA